MLPNIDKLVFWFILFRIKILINNFIYYMKKEEYFFKKKKEQHLSRHMTSIGLSGPR